MVTLMFLCLIFIIGFLAGGTYGFRTGYDESCERISKLIDKAEKAGKEK